VVVQVAIALFLLSAARPSLLENWTRPLKGPHSVFHVPREKQYFADMTQWHVETAYWKARDALAGSACDIVAIDNSEFTLEYPLQALLRAQNPRVQFVHGSVHNPSAKYAPPVKETPCIALRLTEGPEGFLP
jgi:hypothetical protein